MPLLQIQLVLHLFRISDTTETFFNLVERNSVEYDPIYRDNVS